MAKINREIFVPYVKNLCALHLLMRKLSARKATLEDLIQRVNQGNACRRVQKPYEKSLWTPARIWAIIIAIAIAIPWVFCPYSSLNFSASFYIAPISCVAISVALIVGTIRGVRETKFENEMNYAHYESLMLENRKIHDKNEEMKVTKLPGLRRELANCSAASNETGRQLEKAYSANIIPGQYRNLHASVYLYDWFNNSMEDDLGMALNTFVLEQIKDRLDVIIRQQGEIILNQQIQQSLTMQSLEEQERHNRAMQDKLDRLQLTEEERNNNLQMIARTNDSLLWYAQQDYIRNIFK